MTRRLGLLLLIVVLLAGLDTWIRHERSVQRDADGVLRALLDPALEIVPDRVRVVRLQPAVGIQWRYQRQGDTWRFPAYFNAYVHADRMNALLGTILGAIGTRATDDADAHDDLGVADHQAMRVIFEDGNGPLAAVLLGRGVPGPDAEESYARVAGSDLALHLHANPQRLLGDAQPPLLDPHLLPRDERRQALVRLQVAGPQGNYVLQRVLAPLPEGAPAMPMDERDRYRWVMQRDARVDTCDEGSVYTWLAWIRSVRFLRLVDPAATEYGLGTAGVLQWTDEQGTADRLQLGRAAGPGERYVSNEAAGLVTVMPTLRAAWLLPHPDLLLQPPTEPSPFESIP